MSSVKAGKDDSRRLIREIFIEQLKKGRTIRMTIKGRSMHPFIKRGDYLIVKPIKFNQIRVGDIIAYKRPSQQGLTTHRVLKKGNDITGDYLVTKGDASIHGDPPIYSEDAYGKVVIIERKNGKIINLESKFHRMQAYFIAKCFWAVSVLRVILNSPNVIPIKVICKIKSLWSK